jgi:hypothetical protein
MFKCWSTDDLSSSFLFLCPAELCGMDYDKLLLHE